MGETPLEGVMWWRGWGVCESPVRFSLNDGPMETVEYMLVNIWCMLDWIIGFCYKIAEIYFLGISWSTFSLFTFPLENSTLSSYVKRSLESNSSNLLISNGVVTKVTVYIYSIKFCSLFVYLFTAHYQPLTDRTEGTKSFFFTKTVPWCIVLNAKNYLSNMVY